MRLVATLFAVIVGAAPPLATASLAAAEAPRTSSECTAEEVLLLVDQSKSLRTTDPTNERRAAGLELINTLATAAVPVRLTIAGFGNAISEPHSFTLGQASSASETRRAEDDFLAVVSRAEDQNTDYVAALDHAISHFEATSAGDVNCRSLVWFTDGAYDIDEAGPDHAVEEYADPADIGSRNFKAIEDNFEEYVCDGGVLINGGGWRFPLSEGIRKANFSISFIDLRTGNETGEQKRLRDATAAVLERLLGDDSNDGCRVPGRILSTQETSGLLAEFFEVGQRALGRESIDCGVLGTGLPISVVKSVAVIADDPDSVVDILDPQGVSLLSSPQTQAAVAVLSDGARASAGNVSVAVSNGAAAKCFVEVEFSLALVGEPQIYSNATSVTLAVRVTGTGLEGKPEGALSDELVRPEILVDGERKQWRYDDATREFRVTQDGPFAGDLTLTATAVFLKTNTAERQPLKAVLTVDVLPPTPTAKWLGKRLVEGPKEIPGPIRVESGIVGTGTLCVKFDGPRDIVSDAGDVIGTLNVSTEQVCRSISEPIDIEASAVFLDDLNAIGSVELTYTVTFDKDADGSLPPEALTKPGVLRIGGFEQVKPANAVAGVAFAVVTAALVALLSYLLLFVVARWQNKLPPTGDWLVARAEVTTRSKPGAPGDVEFIGTGDFQVSSLDSGIGGSRRRYNFGSVGVYSVWPINPLAGMHAVARVASGDIISFPTRSRRGKLGTKAHLPVQFRQLALIHVQPALTSMTIVLPRGSTADDFERAMLDAIGSSNDSLLAARGRLAAATETDRSTGGDDGPGGGSGGDGAGTPHPIGPPPVNPPGHTGLRDLPSPNSATAGPAQEFRDLKSPDS